MHCEKYLLTFFLLSSVAACAANNKSEPEPPAPATKPMALFELSGVSSPEILIYFKPVTDNGKTWLCPKGTAFRGQVMSSAGMVEVILPTGLPVDASPESENDAAATMKWVAVDMNGGPIQYAPDPNAPSADEQFRFGVFFSPLKGDMMLSEYDATNGGYVIERKLRRRKKVPDNVDYKYTVATTKKNANGKWVLKKKCEPLDPVIRILR